MTNQTLPTPGSVWGVPDQPDTWRYVYLVDGLNVRSRSIVTGRVSEEHVAIWESRNREVGSVDITAMLSTAADKLAFLKSKGLTVGMMKESGKEPYLAYVIERGSELCDMENVNKLLDAEIRTASLIAWLKDPNRKPPVIAFTSGPERQIADFALMMRGNSMTCPMCQNGYAGTDCTGEAVDCHYCDGNGNITAESFVQMKDRCEEMVGNAMYRDIVESEEAELNEPHTVDWLVAIGGEKSRLAGLDVVQFHSLTTYGVFSVGKWQCYWKGESLPGRPTTKRDVLKWLDVLGITTTKAGT